MPVPQDGLPVNRSVSRRELNGHQALPAGMRGSGEQEVSSYDEPEARRRRRRQTKTPGLLISCS